MYENPNKYVVNCNTVAAFQVSKHKKNSAKAILPVLPASLQQFVEVVEVFFKKW